MASQNFHKRRTKERKERQRAERRAVWVAKEKERKRGFHAFRAAPIAPLPVISDRAMELLLGERSLRRGPIVVLDDGTGYAKRLGDIHSSSLPPTESKT